MATTTNYGWETPDDTDLVKDGAAAIRTLGSSIDTTTKNLNPETTTGAIAYRSATANVNTALPIGTANQVLRVNSGGTAPEWAAAATGALALTKAQSFTTSATINVNDCFSTTYKNYLILVNNTATSGNFDLNFRLRVSGADETAANYNHFGIFMDGSSTTSVGASSADKWEIGNSIGIGFYQLWIHTPFESAVTGFEALNGSTSRYRIKGGNYNASTSFTGFSLLTSANNMTGTLRVYGLVDA